MWPTVPSGASRAAIVFSLVLTAPAFINNMRSSLRRASRRLPVACELQRFSYLSWGDLRQPSQTSLTISFAVGLCCLHIGSRVETQRWRSLGLQPSGWMVLLHAVAVAGRSWTPATSRCSACGSLVAVFVFFLANESWLNLHGEPRLLQGYNAAEFYGKATRYRKIGKGR